MYRLPLSIFLALGVLALSNGGSTDFSSPLNNKLNGTENFRLRSLDSGILAKKSKADQTLSVADNVALLLINSIRATHQAPPVTYSSALKAAAAACAQQYVASNPGALTTPLPRPDCVGSAIGVTIGGNIQTTSNGVRSIIQDTSGGSWFFQWINNQNAFPPATIPAFSASYQDFTQMVWVASTQVGCAFSPKTVMVSDGGNPATPLFIYICLWTPVGNIPGYFATNVLQDV